jgi:hypothetical protein
MKKNVLAILLLSILIIFLSLSTSEAGFLIELKNGRTIYTENYEMDGNQIILYLDTGTMKFAKDEVKSITKSKRPIEEIEKKEEKISPPKPDENVKGKEPVSGKEDIDQYKKTKKETQKRLDEAKEAYFNAPNKEEKEKARKIMVSISRELFELQDEVAKKNKGIIPKWWQEE